jgi:hypothetical protein
MGLFYPKMGKQNILQSNKLIAEYPNGKKGFKKSNIVR